MVAEAKVVVWVAADEVLIFDILRGDLMKVCVPTDGEGVMDDLVGQHFGRALSYAMLDTDTRMVESIQNTSQHHGGDVLPPELLASHGVEIMLCGGLGPKAVQMFENFGIEVFIGAQGTVGDAIESWESGLLSRATKDNACQSHGH